MRVGLVGRWNRLVCFFLGHVPSPYSYRPSIDSVRQTYCERCWKPLPEGYDLI